MAIDSSINAASTITDADIFDAHVGGKLSVQSKMPLNSKRDLSIAYTPGVAQVSRAIAADPSMHATHTWASRLVVVVSDGTAVLGLGDIGAAASLPVMEGKSALLARGRYPHQSMIRQWSKRDEAAVVEAMAATNVTSLSGRQVDELSGGQRQRVWVAMALAQQTPTLLLDEPTTYLDIAHQIELMELFSRLNRENNQTMVAVLHDLNHACRYATHLIAMKDGNVVAAGNPAEIVTAELVEEVFGLPCMIIPDPVSKTPLVIPWGSMKP